MPLVIDRRSLLKTALAAGFATQIRVDVLRTDALGRVAEIGESAGDAIVTPAFVLLGNADDERFDFRADTRTSRVGATLREPSNLRAIRRRYQAKMVSGLPTQAKEAPPIQLPYTMGANTRPVPLPVQRATHGIDVTGRIATLKQNADQCLLSFATPSERAGRATVANENGYFTAPLLRTGQDW